MIGKIRSNISRIARIIIATPILFYVCFMVLLPLYRNVYRSSKIDPATINAPPSPLTLAVFTFIVCVIMALKITPKLLHGYSEVEK